ncbi:MAG: hypothetical protein Q9213_007695 [Squamulea squamosa]
MALQTILTRAEVGVACFETSDHPIVTTTYHDCFQVIKFLMSHGRTRLPTLFSRKPNVGYELPEQWIYRSCLLYLDMVDDDEEETTSFKDVAVAAGTVMVGCVVRPPHMGGTQYVGPKRVMNVTLFGTPVRSRRPVRLMNDKMRIEGLGDS